MPETHKSKRFEAICFKRSLIIADYGYLSMEANYTCMVLFGQGKHKAELILLSSIPVSLKF
jgi:hypothetical protein